MKVKCSTCDLCLGLMNAYNEACPCFPCNKEEVNSLRMQGDLVTDEFLNNTKHILKKKMAKNILLPEQKIILEWKILPKRKDQ